jgi:NAD(P)-dependent dehydrogenase (short-subunit alcohol dehydrogenase family)
MRPALIVTGGSRGIGAACVRLAAARGWSVAFNYKARADAARLLVAEVEAAGGRALAVRGDVAREGDVIDLFDAAETAFGPVAGLVNNAGVLGALARLVDISLDRWEATLAVNLTGAFLCAREAVRRMVRTKTRGAIVNVSSMAAVLGGSGEFTDYAASKGALDTLTVGLAKEVAGDGIRVNGVRPGLIDTDIHDAGRLDRLVATVPMGRVGSAEEVARTVLWLLSDEAAYTTGVTVNVSGGR